MRCLLDKVAARRILEGLLKLEEAREPTEGEFMALDFFTRAKTEGWQLYIAPQTEALLHQLESLPRYADLIHVFLRRTKNVFPTNYFKHWRRRLQKYSFTREDAGILALATFGAATDAQNLGMHFCRNL